MCMCVNHSLDFFNSAHVVEHVDSALGCHRVRQDARLLQHLVQRGLLYSGGRNFLLIGKKLQLPEKEKNKRQSNTGRGHSEASSLKHPSVCSKTRQGHAEDKRLSACTWSWRTKPPQRWWEGSGSHRSPGSAGRGWWRPLVSTRCPLTGPGAAPNPGAF